MVEFKNLSEHSGPIINGKALGNPKVSFSSLSDNSIEDNFANVPRKDNSKVLYSNAVGYLTQVFKEIKAGKSFSLESGFQIIGEMVKIQPFQNDLFIMAIHRDYQKQYILDHSINVAIFAIKMGDRLGYSKDRQIEIGMAALLHDVGMAVIPDRIINKNDKLNPQELKIVKGRAQNSYNILKPFSKEHPYLAECAVQVHERIDGTGYPQGLVSDDIHEYAKIVGLMEMYEALIHSRPYRDKYLYFDAVKKIIKTYKRCFQRKYLKEMLNIFSIFPIHSYVSLNSKAIGKVIKTDPDHPMRPRLQIMYDSQKKKVLTERIVDLSENPLLYIVDSVSKEDLNGDSGI